MLREYRRQAVSWKKMTIGQRMASGFGLIVMLLILSGLMSYSGLGGIVHDAGK